MSATMFSMTHRLTDARQKLLEEVRLLHASIEESLHHNVLNDSPQWQPHHTIEVFHGLRAIAGLLQMQNSTIALSAFISGFHKAKKETLVAQLIEMLTVMHNDIGMLEQRMEEYAGTIRACIQPILLASHYNVHAVILAKKLGVELRTFSSQEELTELDKEYWNAVVVLENQPTEFIPACHMLYSPTVLISTTSVRESQRAAFLLGADEIIYEGWNSEQTLLQLAPLFASVEKVDLAVSVPQSLHRTIFHVLLHNIISNITFYESLTECLEGSVENPPSCIFIWRDANIEQELAPDEYERLFRLASLHSVQMLRVVYGHQQNVHYSRTEHSTTLEFPVPFERLVRHLFVHLRRAARYSHNDSYDISSPQLIGEVQRFTRHGFWAYNPVNKNFEISDRVKSLLGIPLTHQVSFLQLCRKVVAKDIPLLLESVRMARNAAILAYCDVRLAQKEDIVLRIHIIWQEKNGVEQFSGTIQDVSDSKLVEEELRQDIEILEKKYKTRTTEFLALQERMQVLEQHSADAVTIIDSSGNILYESGSTAQIFGSAIEHFLEETLFSKMQPADKDALMQAITHLAHSDEPSFMFEWQSLSGKGESIWIESIVSNYSYHSAVNGFVINSRDITARKRSEQAMQSALEHEHELNIMRSRFIDVVSHEFRTPLTVLSASLSILKNYSDRLTPSQKNTQFVRMRDGISRLTELMEDVNALSRILEQQHEFSITDIMLQEFLSMMQYTLQESFPGRSLVLPNKDAMHCVVSTDVDLLRSVVYNILRNSFKYSPDTTNVICNVWCTENLLEWEIIDNGYGIPDGEKQFIFDAFFRGSNCTHIPGVGIGLFLAKRALEGLRGTVEYSNNPKGGTIVRCSVPVIAIRPCVKQESFKL